MRKVIIIVGIIVMLGLAFFLMSWLAGMSEPPAQQTPEDIIRKVKAVEVSYAEVDAGISATGRLGSKNYVDVISEVQGEILPAGVPLKKGQNFKKGDLLVKIFDKPAEFNLKAAKSRFMNSIANILPDFKIDYPESYPKIKQFFNELRLDQPLPELPVIESEQERIFLASRNVLNDYFTIKNLEIQLDRHSIHAPFNGTFTDVMLEVGSIANPGSHIARIIRTDRLELEVPVTVEDAIWLENGQKVDVWSEDKEIHRMGQIVRIADFVDPNSQSVSVFVSLEPAPGKPLYEGQYLQALFNGRKIGNAMVIPRSAVFNSNEVYVVNEGSLRKALVNVLKVDHETLIFNGLEEGSIVVAEPLAGASEGEKVDVSL